MTPRDWNEMKKLLGDRADQETLEAVKALVEGIETNLKGSLTANVVKNIQRGTITPKSATAEVTLSGFTNLDKMVVLLNGHGYVGLVFTISLNSLSTTKLVVNCGGNSSSSSSYVAASYQVIEFY